MITSHDLECLKKGHFNNTNDNLVQEENVKTKRVIDFLTTAITPGLLWTARPLRGEECSMIN